MARFARTNFCPRYGKRPLLPARGSPLTHVAHTEAERQHFFERLARTLRLDATQERIAAQPVVSHLARPLDRAKVPNQMNKPERQRSSLSRSEQISRPAQFQIGLCHSGSGGALAHELKA